ncbi:MAG: ABC transporter ATP-binding protein [Bacillota bacterium]|nr:ABC transporter ATP-binding protein [Bacillota bacterium]
MKVKNLSFSYNQKPFIENLNIEFKENQITTIIGSNGSGKSTLLMLLSRLYKPQEGNIEIDVQNIWNYKIKDFAKKVAVVHQKNQIYGDQDVKTIVGYGRLPYLHYAQKLTQEDYEIIDWALEVTNLKEYQNRTLKSLSGGQQQRVWIAMALAQKTPYLLLDEPTTYLDIRYQLELLRLLKEINQKYKITIIMVLHDINQAIQYSDNIIAMKKGRIIVEGKAKEVITSEVIREVYRIDLKMTQLSKQPYVFTV